MLILNKEYRFINSPRIFVKIKEILELDNEEIYIQYIKTNTLENTSYLDWQIIKEKDIVNTFEFIPKEEGWIDINQELPEAHKDVKVYTSENEIRYVTRCGCTPKCKTWKSLGYTIMLDVVKWKYI